MNYPENFMETLVSLAKRRGFVFPSAEIYGGVASVWDFGPLGALLKMNVRREWMKRFVYQRNDILPIESAILTKREVLRASGHEGGFTDPLVECTICHERYRADHEVPAAKDHQHQLTEAKQFNLMFRTHAGPVESENNLVYLRPETAQGMFVNFKLVQESMRQKPPFGIAQVGKSFRNEITPGNFIFRTREFEQGEIEFFVPPADAGKWYEKWVGEWEKFFADFGLSGERVRTRTHEQEELAHYSAGTKDIEYEFPFGWSELAGIANRTDFDLKQHIEHSGQDLSFFDEETKSRFVPFVIEPTLGIDRAALAFLVHALTISDGTDGREAGEVVLKLDPRLAPVTAAVFPLVKKDGMPEIAQEVIDQLRAANIGYVQYDASGSIGKRYRRHDEIGTPFCITIDGQTKEDQTVTVRHRDTLKQDRIKIDELANYLKEQLV